MTESGLNHNRRMASRLLTFAVWALVLGSAVFDRQHHFRLHVGPVDAAAFEALLPTGAALPAGSVAS